jgi:hypothetical protein
VEKVFNALRCCPSPSENFPDFSVIYSHFSLSLFYLLEGSKIFFMSFKYFIWLVHVPMYLWEFSWNFQNLLSIFHAFKTISRFSRIVFAFKIISERNPILSVWAEPEGPTAPAPAQPPDPPRPIGQAEPWPWPPPPSWRACHGKPPRPRTYKGRRSSSARPSRRPNLPA